jgi:protein TonB
MKTWLIVSLILHAAAGWLLYNRLALPPQVPRDTTLTLNLVQLAPLPQPRQAEAPKQEAPQPAEPEIPKPEPPQKIEAPKPKPKEPEPPKPKEPVTRKTASPLHTLLAKVKEQRDKREQDEKKEKPTPTPRSLAQSVPTIKPLDLSSTQVAQNKPSRKDDRPQGPVAIDIPEGMLQYNYYFSAIGNTLRRNWTVPQLPRVDRYLAVVELTILRDGRVLRFGFIQRSGNRLFDQSVENAIQVSKFPPFAADYRESSMTVTVRFRPESA